jgi:hypothetical protein
MRDPATVLASTRKRYDKDWRTCLADAPAEGFSFPLGAVSATTAARETEAVARWLRTWRRWAAQHAGVSLRPARIATAIGPQQPFTHLDVPSVEALAGLASDTRDHWQKSSRRYPMLRDLAASEHRLKPHLKQIMDLDDYDFDLLLRAAAWFLENARSGLTLRQVPVIGMHTKWTPGS